MPLLLSQGCFSGMPRRPACSRHHHPCRWLIWCCWREHLRRLHATMRALRPRLVLACTLRRWQAAVWAAQADDGSICHRALQLPRSFAAWRQQAHRQAELRWTGEQCQRLLAYNQQHRVLAAWRQRAVYKQAACGKQEQAAAAWMARLRRIALIGWRKAAQRKAACRAQRQQAETHWSLRMAGAALRSWHQVASLRRMSCDWHPCYLLIGAFGSWRQLAQRTAREAARWRSAVRHFYLRQLRAGLEGFMHHHHRRQQKEQRLRAMRQYHLARMLRCCLGGWAGPSLAAARSKRAKQQQASEHLSRRVLQLVVTAWGGPFLTAARQRRQLQQAADSWRATRLLHKAWLCWQGRVEQQAEHRQQVAAAMVLLRPARLRTLLAAWRRCHLGLVWRRTQVGAKVLLVPGCVLQLAAMAGCA